MLGYTDAQNLCQKVLSRCGSDPAEVLFSTHDGALTRFANNTIHQNVSERNATLSLRCFIDKRAGMATTNRLDDAALDELVRRARTNAQASRADSNDPGLPGPAAYSPAKSFDQPTAETTPRARAQAVGAVCRLAAEKGLNASGAFTTGAGEVAIANSQDLSAYHAATYADFQTVVMSEDSAGHAHASSWRLAEIPVEALGREAILKAERGRKPRSIEPGEYSVVFDPYVTDDLVTMLDFHGMSAQAVLEGRSWMNDRIGVKAMSSLVSIWDDGLDPQGMPLPFDYEGLPKQRVDIVQQGRVESPVYDRATALKAGKTSTGHARPPAQRSMGPFATNLFMAPGEASLEEMIRSTERGLYITRFWYTRLVHPRKCVVTGMTRDGVFVIEKGEVAYPVKNLRFTQSYVNALADVEAVGRETRLLMEDPGGLVTRVPALKISRFRFTGRTA